MMHKYKLLIADTINTCSMLLFYRTGHIMNPMICYEINRSRLYRILANQLVGSSGVKSRCFISEYAHVIHARSDR